MSTAAERHLSDLGRRYAAYGPGSSGPKLARLAALASASLRTAPEVERLHEILCFLRAYPDDAALLAAVEERLAAFEARRDLRRRAPALADTGIAGTAIHFRFFAPQARRLARRFPRELSIDWSSFDGAGRLGRLFPLLTLYAERAAFDDPRTGARAWLRRFATGEGDAAFLLRAWDALPADEMTRSAFYEDLDPPLRLRPGPGTPARTREKLAPLPVVFQTEPLSRARPALREELGRPPVSVRGLSAREAEPFIELARDTMVTRARDLEVFEYAHPDDVRLVDAGHGFQLACMGVLPERRSLLEAVYAFLMLKNGVAVGYALCSALFGSSEVAYNVFQTFRGGETAWMFGRLLAAIHGLFGSDAFAIDPYQLGHGNDEGLRSGAFWFYQKLGFRPRAPALVRRMEQELERMRRRPGYRSPRPTLKVLASAYAFWQPAAPRDDVLGALAPSNVALHVSRHLTLRFGADRDRARLSCLEEAGT
ncbi:MAG: hypothetical protein HY908_08380, partial [Myxococcales bacterium]|nr:hypothetical protein [Myxococcales bacterium]